jgi:hypothetical protein
MDQGRPRTFGFDRSENRLMIRRGLACSDRRIFNQDIVFAGDFPDLIKQSRGFRRIFELRLMLLHPLVPFRPGVALSHVDSLLGQLASPGGELLLRARDCAPERTQNPKIQQHNNRARDNPREHTLAPVHSSIPRRHHLGFPSRRNCA